MKILLWFGLSIICGLFYRAGGKGEPFNTKWRDLGCPAICLSYLWLLRSSGLQGALWLKISLFLVTYGLMFGALTTYWDWLFKEDNFWFHGFAIGLVCFPLFWAGINWWLIGIRAIILAIGMGLWSKIIGNDFWEEFGRGSLIILTIPLLI